MEMDPEPVWLLAGFSATASVQAGIKTQTLQDLFAGGIQTTQLADLDLPIGQQTRQGKAIDFEPGTAFDEFMFQINGHGHRHGQNTSLEVAGAAEKST